MALLDDPSFIISHIRHSFITSDDTGLCEMVIMNEEVDYNRKKLERQAKKTNPWSTYSVPDGDSVMEDATIYNESYDIESSFEMGFRQRTNTAMRLEKLRRERKIQNQCKRVQWRENEQQLSAEDLNILFAKKEVVPVVKNGKSALAVQLAQFPNQTNNPFSEYSKFDGKAHIGSGNVKKINIYFTMATEDRDLQPLTVYVLCTAKVLDLVGLLCWHYTNRGTLDTLSDNVESYCLMIAEEDGEVDTDFPALDNRELIARFGFPTLALVELNPKTVNTTSQKTDEVVVNITSSDGASKIPIENVNITMRELLQKTLRRRKGIIPRTGPHYTLEKESFPGEKVDMDCLLSDVNTLDFVLVREHSKRESIPFIHESSGNSQVTGESPLVPSSQFKSYRIQMLHKNVLRPPSAVDFGLSAEKVEIVPIMQLKTKKLWSKQKAYSISSDKLADCFLVNEGKSSGKLIFRLVYLATSRDFKYHEFEAKSSDIKEIVAKIQQVLDLRSSQVRRDYLYLLSKKQLKKQEK